ncbi:SdpI family protein [Proteocatella sphenisci]|uniref:SdpI family protein n=1 Tax=Proteocatella sphenisci TaxID=181070 RepID=UPI00048B5807|nr:SdpI family protein [Proteocatella sphenisci]
MKQHKKIIIITSILALIPMIAGIIMWDKMPDQVATHWGFNNIANGWSSKAFAVFGIPLMLFAIHIFTVFVTLNDPKKKNIGSKMLTMVFFVIPVTSIITCLSVYAIALGLNINIGLMINVLVGVLFIIIGIYLPSIKQNYTVGIKLPWTLNSEENWDKTSKFSGKLWVAGGVCVLINTYFQSTWILLIIITVISLIPVIYSFLIYKK